MPSAPTFHLAIALDGAGWHPAAWRLSGVRPGELFAAAYWRQLVQEAEAARLDLVTIEDGLSIQSSRWEGPDDRTDQVRGRLDANLIASRVAPVTSAIGLVPTVTTTHTEPFHVAKALATLDFVSNGRAGWRVQVSPRTAEAAHFGRRTLPTFRPGEAAAADPVVRQAVADLFDEATDVVEVVRRLWDSWEDDAEIGDVSTGRFVDRGKLHYVDFKSRWFRVRGPSITPRPPQGHPPVALLAHGAPALDLAARCADLLFVTPRGEGGVRRLVEEVRAHEQAVRREVPLRIFADLVVLIDRTAADAASRRDHLDELDGRSFRSDAVAFAGSAAELADLVMSWWAAGIEGFRFRPAMLPHDLRGVTEGLVPELRRRGAFRHEYGEVTLRERLGLRRPASRYAA